MVKILINGYSFLDGSDAYEIEQYILKKYKYNRCVSEKILVSGNSELFDTDIFRKGKL